MKRENYCCLPLLLAAWLGGGSLVWAQGQDFIGESGTNDLTLEVAVREALARNPGIRVWAADIAAAQGEVTTVKTWANPELSVAPGFDRTVGPTDTKFYGEVGFEQTVEWPGKRALRRALAEKNTALRELALAGFRAQLTIQVRRAYFGLETAGELVELREQQVRLAQSFVAAATKKVAGGLVPEFEATKAEVEAVTAQKLLRDAQARRDAARVALNALMGRNPTDPLVISGGNREAVPLPDQSTLLAQALAHNPAVALQEARVEQMGLSLQSIRKSRLADFKVGPGLQYNRDEQMVVFGVTFPLPLWDRKKGEIATATAEQEKALAELDQLRREILRDVATAAQNVAAAKESLACHSPALQEKLRAALELGAQGYAEGRTPLLLYLELQRTYFDTEAGYFDTRQKLLETQAELESALGTPLDQLSLTHHLVP